MFIKPLQPPIRLQALNALHSRLVKTCPKYEEISGERARRLAGFIGEKKVEYILRTIDEDYYFIFHDLCLKIGDLTFQMDFLLLTSRFALIIEAKNFAGTILFDDQGQFIRILGEQQDGYANPIAQAQYHQRCLRKWLALHHFPPLPIDFIVIVSKPSTIIRMENSDPEVRKRVLPASKLPNYLFHLDQHSKKEFFDPKRLRKLSKLLIKKHSPQYPDLLKEFNLTEHDILFGVQCPKCDFLPMISLKGYWKCLACLFPSRDAHIQATDDLFLLFGPTIKNRQFREFLHISSIQKARKLLKSMNLPYSGDKRGRVYFRPEK